MFKIKSFISTRRLPQVSWIRNYKTDNQCPPRYHCKQPEPHENDLMYEEMKKAAVPPIFRCKAHRDFRIFRNIFFFLCVPAMLCAYINIFYMESEEERMRPKFIPFSYMRIRNKGYPWDPQRTLFHNPDYNALPDGYETEFPPEREYDPKDRYTCPVPRRT